MVGQLLMVQTMLLDTRLFDDPDFKKSFWKWFDNELSPRERKKFQEYPADLAEFNYYNRVWKHENNS